MGKRIGTKFKLALLLCTVLTHQIVLAEEYQTEIGIGHLQIDYGDFFEFGVDIKETQNLIVLQYNFAPVEPKGPLEEATFMSRASNLLFALGAGEFGTSSVNVDVDSLALYGTFFVNENVAIGAKHLNVDIESISDSTSNSVEAIVYTKEFSAISFGLTSADYGYDQNSINLDSKTVFEINDNSYAFDTTIVFNDADDFDATWTDFGLALTFYPEDTTGIGFSIGTTSGDAEERIDLGLNASKFFANNVYLSGEYQVTSYDISDDVTSLSLFLGMRL